MFACDSCGILDYVLINAAGDKYYPFEDELVDVYLKVFKGDQYYCLIQCRDDYILEKTTKRKLKKWLDYTNKYLNDIKRIDAVCPKCYDDLLVDLSS